MSRNSAKIITVANQKGGVGKTTVTMNLGVALASLNRRVLLIDSDPQANLSSYLGVVSGEDSYLELKTLDEIYLSKRPIDQSFKESCIAKTEAGVDLIASDQALSGVEHYLFTRPDREMVLARVLKPIREDYDYIFIDTPPSLNLLTLNALCASDSVLIPIQPQFFSLEGIVKIREAIENVRSRWNENLKIEGVVASQVSQRRRLTGEVLSTLKDELGPVLFKAMIHDNAAVAESSGHAESVLSYDRSSRGAQDFMAVADELLRRNSHDKEVKART